MIRFKHASFEDEEVKWALKYWLAEPYKFQKFEIKCDGFRAAAVKFDGRTTLMGRENEFSLLAYPELIDIRLLPDEWIVDAELVSDSFTYIISRNQLLDENRIINEASRKPCKLFMFDLPYWKKDLRWLPYDERRKRLEEFYQHATGFLKDKMPYDPSRVLILAPSIDVVESAEEIRRWKREIEEKMHVVLGGDEIKADGIVIKPDTVYGKGWHKTKPHKVATLPLKRWYDNSKKDDEWCLVFVLEAGKKEVPVSMGYHPADFSYGARAHDYAKSIGAKLGVVIRYLRDHEYDPPYRLPVFLGFSAGGEFVPRRTRKLH